MREHEGHLKRQEQHLDPLATREETGTRLAPCLSKNALYRGTTPSTLGACSVRNCGVVSTSSDSPIVPCLSGRRQTPR
jgi:hypothetical protein